MDKYKAVAIVNICEIICALGIITLAGIFNNWWLLFLLILLGASNTERRLLGLKEDV